MTALRSRPLVTREQRHRQWLLLSIGGLLVLSTAPVFGHHLTLPAGWWPVMDHIGALCFSALELLLSPVHDGFHVVVVSGVLYAIFDRVRAARLQRKALAGLSGSHPDVGSSTWRAARAVGLAPARVVVVTGLPNPAFTAGFFRPRVYLARQLSEYLRHEELVAVLAHEHAHLVRRDPLRLFLLRALAATLFWLPALRRLADDLADEAEILADDAAAAHTGNVPLASAILAIAEWPKRTVPVGVGFAHPDVLDRRIRRLMGEDPRLGTHVTWRSIFAAVGVLAVVWTSGAVMLHGRAIDGAAATVTEHCEHHGSAPWTHLFCRRSASVATEAPCPHA